jgi:hypothetical protein
MIMKERLVTVTIMLVTVDHVEMHKRRQLPRTDTVTDAPGPAPKPVGLRVGCGRLAAAEPRAIRVLPASRDGVPCSGDA